MEHQKYILVIDDEIRTADSLKTLLEDAGYRVDVAYSGEQALQKLQADPPDLVITDIKMREIDGYDVMRYVREKLPHTYVIVITGYANLESAIEAIRQSAYDYITKPFDFDTLRLSVERAFARMEAERFREDMISMLTHDIRIPLQSIIGYAAEIYNRHTGEWHPRAPEFIRTICIQSQKVLALVDNFLTTCKIEAGRLFLCETQFDLNYFIQDLVTIMELLAEKRNIKIEVELLPESIVFLGDESLLFRALSNVVNNAIKYSPEGSTIKITCEHLPPEKSPLQRESINITVTNPGAGIHPDDLPFIFERYKRARNMRSIEGSGIGLFVVRSVVEAHEGTILVNSQPHETTSFSIILPLRKPIRT